jgi:hypothetical protein
MRSNKEHRGSPDHQVCAVLVRQDAWGAGIGDQRYAMTVSLVASKNRKKPARTAMPASSGGPWMRI